MSSVTQCDWCQRTERRDGPGSYAKVVLPEAAVPEVLDGIGSGAKREFDTCGDCQDRVRAVLSGLFVGDMPL